MTEQREKPPITGNLPQFKATDAEIQAVVKSRHLDESGMPLVEQRMAAMTIILITGVAEAQRDADVAWFKKAGYVRAEDIETGYRKAGMQKVVDWVENQRMAAKTLIEGVGYGIVILDEAWADFKKSEGVIGVEKD